MRLLERSNSFEKLSMVADDVNKDTYKSGFMTKM